MIRTISVTEAARSFADVINRVLYRGESALLMRGGKPVAKIIPAGEIAKTGGELAALWNTFTHLTTVEADSFANDIENARKTLPVFVNKWD